MISKGLNFLKFSGLRGRIWLGIVLIAAVQVVSVVWLLFNNSIVRVASLDTSVSYQPLAKALEQLHDDVGSYAAALRTDILHGDPANASSRNIIREKSLIPGIANVRKIGHAFSDLAERQLDSLDLTQKAIGRVGQDVAQWFFGRAMDAFAESAARAFEASEREAFLRAKLVMLNGLEKQYA